MYGQNPFAGITSGDQAGGARYPFLGGDKGDPINGDYKLNINQIVIRGRGKPNYIIEVDILESNQPQRPAGMRCACFIDITNADTRGKHLCALIASIYGYDPLTLPKDSALAPWPDPGTGKNTAWEDYIQWSCSEQNPFANSKVGCNVRTIETAAGNDFSLHTWKPIGLMVIPASAPIAAARPATTSAPVLQTPGGFAPPGAGPGFIPAAGGGAPGFGAPIGPAPGYVPAPVPQSGGFGPPAGGQPGFGPPQPAYAPAPAPQQGYAPTPQQMPPQQPQYAPVPQPPQQPQYAPQPQQPAFAPQPAYPQQQGFGPPNGAPQVQPAAPWNQQPPRR